MRVAPPNPGIDRLIFFQGLRRLWMKEFHVPTLFALAAMKRCPILPRSFEHFPA